MGEKRCCADGCENPAKETCVVCNRPVCLQHSVLMHDFLVCAECEGLDYIPPKPKEGDMSVVADLSL